MTGNKNRGVLGEEPEETVVPEWYNLVRAARYAGVPAWELEQMPAYWMNRYLMAESAEIRADNILQRQADDPNRPKHRKHGKSH